MIVQGMYSIATSVRFQVLHSWLISLKIEQSPTRTHHALSAEPELAIRERQVVLQLQRELETQHDVLSVKHAEVRRLQEKVESLAYRNVQLTRENATLKLNLPKRQPKSLNVPSLVEQRERARTFSPPLPSDESKI